MDPNPTNKFFRIRDSAFTVPLNYRSGQSGSLQCCGFEYENTYKFLVDTGTGTNPNKICIPIRI
jgi:hypothetical protein